MPDDCALLLCREQPHRDICTLWGQHVGDAASAEGCRSCLSSAYTQGVSCNSGNVSNEVCCRSPAVVVAYLMKQRRWRLTEAYKWVKEHRPETELTSGMQRLQQYVPPAPISCMHGQAAVLDLAVLD